MSDSPQDIMQKLAEVRDRSLTPAQQKERERNTLRAEAIQRGVRRGPDAPANGFYGGVRK